MRGQNSEQHAVGQVAAGNPVGASDLRAGHQHAVVGLAYQGAKMLYRCTEFGVTGLRRPMCAIQAEEKIGPRAGLLIYMQSATTWRQCMAPDQAPRDRRALVHEATMHA